MPYQFTIMCSSRLIFKRRLIQIPYIQMKKFVQTMIIAKIVLIITVALLLTSCSSGWSCKKRYVNNSKSYDFRKHYVLTNYDKMMLEKYKITKP
jgi:hypothetical protein